MDHLRETDLIRRAAGGDREAFDSLVRLHRPSTFALLRRMVGEGHAEDAAQITFLRAWKSLSTFDSSRPFRPWLFAIAVNEGRKLMRAGLRAVSAEGIPPASAPLSPDAMEGPEARARVLVLLADLVEDQRIALLLKFQEGFAPVEIAEIENVSVNTIRLRLSRGIRSLRLRFKETQDGMQSG